MTTTLPVKPGLSAPKVTNIPEQWDKQWFRRFITNYLEDGDTRNSIEGAGITITGNLGTGPATISTTSALTEIFNEPFVLLGAQDGTDLTQFRSLVVDSTLNLTDGGATHNLTLSIAAQSNNTVLGNVSGSTAEPVQLSKAQLTTLVNAFSNTLSGAVPASGGGSTNFLRADGNWTLPSKLTLQTSGWGTPTGASVTSNFNGAGATLAQTSAVVAQIIADLKTLGLYAA